MTPEGKKQFDVNKKMEMYPLKEEPDQVYGGIRITGTS